MMGLAEIERLQNQAARRSARLHLTPLVLWKPEEVAHAPFLGTRVPRGWRLATYADIGEEFRHRHGFYGNDTDLGVLLFCDSSGWGGPSEPALSKEQTIATAAEIIASNPALTFGFGIFEAGQMQVHLRVFVARQRHQ